MYTCHKRASRRGGEAARPAAWAHSRRVGGAACHALTPLRGGVLRGCNLKLHYFGEHTQPCVATVQQFYDFLLCFAFCVLAHLFV